LKFWSRKTDTALQARDKAGVTSCSAGLRWVLLIGAATLGPFVKYAHGVDDKFLLVFCIFFVAHRRLYVGLYYTSVTMHSKQTGLLTLQSLRLVYRRLCNKMTLISFVCLWYNW